ncbi:MAG TPA: hypothetical protein VF622_13395 [Segetibacter sp.]
MAKRILILSFFLILFIGYGLYLMDVEDRYGDLQNLYWDSKDGDIILNKLNSKIGIVELRKSRIFVKEGERLVDVEEWLDPEDKRKFQAAIYRPKLSIKKDENFDRGSLNSGCKLITEVDVEY